MSDKRELTQGVIKMKVVVSSTGKDLNAKIDPRFGRCDCFIIVDTEDMSFVSYDNENKGLSGGAGIQAAGFVVSKGAEAVLTGNCGPNAMTAFSAAGVTVYAGQTGSVREAVERFRTGGIMPLTQANVPEKAGVSTTVGTGAVPTRGIGRCRGGSGRGMGGGGGKRMGGGRGMAMRSGNIPPLPDSGGTPAASRKDTLETLKKQAEELQHQMEAIQTKINSIE
ncbi:NifB/NifX family molybdenum-iron cluster-binding protein [Desulfobacterium sp. N47]|uniref:NifB/NifX family molybdenum-iron cluster-binding protein n=1 Tax=Desulfobacterium sp. N47 TaxID=3115210 RepID=UPI003CB15D59